MAASTRPEGGGGSCAGLEIVRPFYIGGDRMDILQAILGMIGNYGFPVVMCLILYNEMKEERKAHKEESAVWVDALNRNTLAIEKISIYMEEKK